MKKESNMVLISILIPTLTNRTMYFKRITDELNRQIVEIHAEKEVEILAYCDNRQKTTGHKRNVLLNKAVGKFTVFVDDDDRVDPKYIYEILKVIKENDDIDCIGIQGLYNENGGKYEPFETSLKHNWEKRNGWYYRTINHISPILRKHALEVKFPDKTRFEDYEWTMALKKTGLLKKEVVIKKPMYIYEYVHVK